MEYRVNKRTGDRVSVLGLGASSIAQADAAEGVETLRLAFDSGINYFDLAAGEAACFPYYGSALSDVRSQVRYQIHFGANYAGGAYGWTTSLDAVKKSIDWQLKTVKTDYIDYGMIHCLDEEADWERYQKNGVLRLIEDLKRQGIVRHIGLSSHTPELAHKALDTGLLDMMMFSINAAYDYQQGEYGIGSVDARSALYRRCEAEGVGIAGMKPFAGGTLLNDGTSPFKKALTEYQCLQYALDKPGVLTVLPGIRGKKDLEKILGFVTAGEEEKDYSVIGHFAPADAEGKCVYCNHCQPCPAGLDVALINKYYDLALAGDKLAADHYRKLEKNAGDCVACGHCNRRCPFHVDQCGRMEEITQYFN